MLTNYDRYLISNYHFIRFRYTTYTSPLCCLYPLLQHLPDLQNQKKIKEFFLSNQRSLAEHFLNWLKK